jgi:hypothetical protein
MKLRTILLSLLLACAAQGQTLKSLMYNTTNGQVAYSGTNVLNFVANENAVLNDTPASFSANGFTMSIVVTDENLEVGYDAPSGSIGVGTDQFWIKYGTNVNDWARPLLIKSEDYWPGAFLGATWLTNTNVTNFRTAIGLGDTNVVTFDVVRSAFGFRVQQGTNIFVYIGDDVVEMSVPLNIYAADGISFAGSNAVTSAAATRTNLGLGWSALTNTNEVNFYTATLTSYSSLQAAIQNDPGTARGDLELANGITATNTFVAYNGTNYTTNTVTISNGIITGWTQ